MTTTPDLATKPKPPSEHQVAFALNRSPIMVLLEQVIATSTLDQVAKRQALAAAEQMFTNILVRGRASRTNPWPAIHVLEAFDIRPARIERDNAFLSGTTPAGVPFSFALPTDPPCSASNA